MKDMLTRDVIFLLLLVICPAITERQDTQISLASSAQYLYIYPAEIRLKIQRLALVLPFIFIRRKDAPIIVENEKALLHVNSI